MSRNNNRGMDGDRNVSNPQNEENDVELLPIEQVNAQEIKESYPVLALEDVKIRFDRVRKKWIEALPDSATPFDLLKLSLRNFQINNDMLKKRNGMKEIDKQFKKALYEVVMVYEWFAKNGILKEIDSKTELHYNTVFNKIFEMIYYAKQNIDSMYHIRMPLDPEYDSSMNDDMGLYRFMPRDLTQNSSYQNLELYILDMLYQNRYRRYGQNCYKQVFNDQGKFTYSWIETCSIKEFIYKNTQINKNYQQWHNATKNPGNRVKLAEQLEMIVDPQFPELVRDRHVFSFKNGVYITKLDVPGFGELKDYFYRYGDKPPLPTTIVSCKYFDADFEDYSKYKLHEWEKIPTPSFQKVIDYQFKHLPDYKLICEWMYAFLGRMLYSLKEVDRWQVLPYVNGVAGSGKSSISGLVQKFYEACDVGMIENRGEEVFGLAPVCKKMFWVAPEVKKNFNMDQALLQKIISGEDCSLPQKNRDPINITWNLPGMMCSNEYPNFMDAAGSIVRRFIIFRFSKPVKDKDSDPNLALKLEKEIPRLLKKANMAYLNVCERYEGKDIWNVLPDYFKDTKENLGVETNALKHFMASGKLVFGDKLYCSDKSFNQAFTDHCHENGFKRPRLTENVYEEPFAFYTQKHKLTIEIRKEKGTKRRYPMKESSAKIKTGNWFIGFDIRAMHEQMTEEEEETEEFSNMQPLTTSNQIKKKASLLNSDGNLLNI